MSGAAQKKSRRVLLTELCNVLKRDSKYKQQWAEKNPWEVYDWRSELQWLWWGLFMFASVAAISIGILITGGYSLLIPAGLSNLLGMIILADPLLDLAVIGALGLMLGLAVAYMVNTIILINIMHKVRDKADAKSFQRHCSRLAAVMILLFSTFLAIVSIVNMPWYFAALIGLGSGLAGLVIILGFVSYFLSNVYSKPGFFSEFIAALSPINARSSSIGLNPTLELVPAGQLQQSDSELYIPLACMQEGFFNLQMDDQAIADAFAKLTASIQEEFKAELNDDSLQAHKAPIQALLTLVQQAQRQATEVKEENAEAALSQNPLLIEFDRALHACQQAGVGAQRLAPIAKKLGQYKAMQLSLLLTELSSSMRTVLGSYALPGQQFVRGVNDLDYTLLVANLPQDFRSELEGILHTILFSGKFQGVYGCEPITLAQLTELNVALRQRNVQPI